MKTKNYRYGKLTCKGWLRPAGNGYEVCFTFGTKNVFVGNFIHATEANQWWTLMNREIRTFGNRYKAKPTFSSTKYGHFLSAHLYNRYYSFLDKVFAKHTKTWNRAVVRDLRSFKRIAGRTPSSERTKLLKAA
jgi:hypothetical protein